MASKNSSFYETIDMYSPVIDKLTLFQVIFFLIYSEPSKTISLSPMDVDLSLGLSLRQCLHTVGSNFFDINKDIICTEYKKSGTSKIQKIGIDWRRDVNWTFYLPEIYSLQSIFHCYDKNYLLEIGSYEDVKQAFQIIKQTNCWNPNQRIFIYSSSISFNQSAELLQMISLTQKQMLSNVVIMLPTREEKFVFQLYYWSTWDNEKCVGKSKYPHFFSCSFGNIRAFQEINKGPSACSLNVKAIAWPPFVLYKSQNEKASSLIKIKKSQLGGVEVEMMNLVSELLGVGVEYYVSTKENWGRSFFNGSLTESMDDLMTKRVDIAIGSLTISLSRYFLFETSIPYTQEYLVCCVPFLSHFDKLSTFLDTPSLNVYFSIYLIYVLLTSTVWIAAQFSKNELRIYKNGPSVFLYTFAAMIGNSVSILPKTRRVRMFFLMLMIFELFYVAFYQSLLTSVLSTQKFDQEIKTFGDILKRNMDIYNQPDNHRYLEFQRKKIVEMISKHWINCRNTTECLEDVYNSDQKAICLGRSYKNYITQNREREGKPPLYCIKKPVVSYPVVMIMRKSLPFKKKIDDFIGRISASGLVSKWTTSMFYNSTKQSFSVPNAFSGILRFSHLKPIFLLVGIGFCIAWLVLISEKLCFFVLKKI